MPLLLLLLLVTIALECEAPFTDVDGFATGGRAAKPGDPMTGFGTPVEVALTGAEIFTCCAAGAAVVPAVSFGVSSPLYIPAAICACVCAWTSAWAIVQIQCKRNESDECHNDRIKNQETKIGR